MGQCMGVAETGEGGAAPFWPASALIHHLLVQTALRLSTIKLNLFTTTQSGVFDFSTVFFLNHCSVTVREALLEHV